MNAAFVLVHLGAKPYPDYGYDCIEQIRLFNEAEPVFLLLDDECMSVDNERLARTRCTVVRRKDLRTTLKHRFYRSTNLMRFKGLRGFWLYAVERFFLIEELMRKFELGNVIHLENDVLSYFEIAKSLDRFRSLYPRMAIVRDHDKRCIASLMFIRNQRSIARLNAFISYNLLTRRKNDMELLSSYCKDKMMQLPIVSPSYAARFALVNLRNERPRDSESFCKNEGEFEMLFDAASFGQFVGGVDKVHSAADSRGFVNETAYVNPSKGQVNWMRDAKGRLCPIFRFDGIEDKIANLHIHSKELCKYRSDRKS